MAVSIDFGQPQVQLLAGGAGAKSWDTWRMPDLISVCLFVPAGRSGAHRF